MMKQKKVFELDRYGLEQFAQWVNAAQVEIQQIAVRYELSNQPLAEVLANSFHLSRLYLPKIYMKLVHNSTYQEGYKVKVSFTQAEMYALRTVVGIINLETPKLNNTDELRQLMLHIQI